MKWVKTKFETVTSNISGDKISVVKVIVLDHFLPPDQLCLPRDIYLTQSHVLYILVSSLQYLPKHVLSQFIYLQLVHSCNTYIHFFLCDAKAGNKIFNDTVQWLSTSLYILHNATHVYHMSKIRIIPISKTWLHIKFPHKYIQLS